MTNYTPDSELKKLLMIAIGNQMIRSGAYPNIGVIVDAIIPVIGEHHPQPTSPAEGELRDFLLTYRHAKTSDIDEAVDALNITMARINALIAADRIKFIETLEGEIPEPENFGNGFDDLIRKSEVTDILRRHKEGTK